MNTFFAILAPPPTINVPVPLPDISIVPFTVSVFPRIAFLVIRIPPATISADISVVPLIIALFPMVIFFPIPTPPAITTAPEETSRLSVVPYTFIMLPI